MEDITHPGGIQSTVAFLVPASAAFAAALTAFQGLPEGTVLEDGLLQGELRRQIHWQGPLSYLWGESMLWCLVGGNHVRGSGKERGKGKRQVI